MVAGGIMTPIMDRAAIISRVCIMAGMTAFIIPAAAIMFMIAADGGSAGPTGNAVTGKHVGQSVAPKAGAMDGRADVGTAIGMVAGGMVAGRVGIAMDDRATGPVRARHRTAA